MDAANKKDVDGSSNDMDTSTSVLGKRCRTSMEGMDTAEATDGNAEKRPRGGALDMALAADLDVAKERAQ